jgi:hypothetical protein
MEPIRDTPSLLLTLLTTDSVYERPITATMVAPSLDATIASEIQNNIKTVVDAVKPHPVKRDLIKDAAQKQLYHVLYEIIEKEYEEPEHEPETEEYKAKAEKDRAFNRTLNGAIGMALESAIQGASRREAEGKASKGDDIIIKLRDELRRKIIEALRPK